ncbi:MAG: glycosyltransferase [Defluviimonas sp.]|uniref:glycosyltransferase n=1 Tax=Albidovulum sp. TaxID=1872424 RepID=UPI002A350C31|nr:glycosyltransferase [Defluviimonas sp.]
MDYCRSFNNREHNAVRYYAGRGDRVTLVGKRLNRTAGLRAALRDGLTSRTEEVTLDGATIRTIDPFLNFFGGIARRASANRASTDHPRPMAWLKGALIRLARPFSLLREVAATGAFVTAAWRPSARADVVVAFGPWAALPAWLLKRAGRVRHLVYVDRDYEAGLFTDTRQAVTAWLERALPGAADTFITIGPRLQGLRVAETGLTPLICETGVDFDRMAAARATSGASAEAFGIVYVGNVIEWSGVGKLLSALPHLPEHVSVRIVGDGLPGFTEHLRRRATELGVADRVSFTGPVPYAKVQFQLGGMALGFALSEPNAYRTYAYPLKVLEYFAAGLPVVATVGTEGGDIVARAEAGIVLPQDVAALSDAIAALAADPERYARMRQNALATAQAFSWTRSFDRERAAIVANMQAARRRP